MPSVQIVLAFMGGLGLGSVLTAVVISRLGRARKRTDALRDADRKRYAELSALISEDVVGFLRSVGNGFERERLSPMLRFTEVWHGASHRFRDPQIDDARMAVLEAATRFLRYVGGETFDLGNGMQGAPPEWKSKDPQRYARVVRELGEHAATVIAARERLVTVARDRLRL
jgi:hypothetical protein